MNGLKTLKGNYSIYRFSMLLFASFAAIFAILYAKEYAKNSMQPEYIYVLDGEGNVGSVTKRIIGREEITAEIINHLSMFTKLMYENDQHSYEQNISFALNLAGDVGMEIADEKEQENELRRMIQLNVRSTVEIDYDSFITDRDENGRYYGSFQFKRNMIRAADNKEETATLLFTINYKIARTNSVRTVKNPHAMNIISYVRNSIRL